MKESDFIKLRQQMEENNMELHNFLDDFDNWKSEVNRKREKLSSEANSSDISWPSIRNVLTRKKKTKTAACKKVLYGENSKINKSERIRGYDYRAWDKFDVDKACADIDKPEEIDELEESETDEEWEDERRLKLAELEKDHGNIRFKEGKLEESIEHYTTAIRLAPENPLLYTNRALALFKFERFASAESDCSTALSINPKLVKALFRRAQARKRLDKTEDAIADLKRILDFEPRNLAAIKDLREWTGDEDLKVGTVNSIFKLVDINKLDSDSLAQEMRRIPIREFSHSKNGKGKSSLVSTPNDETPRKHEKPLILETSDAASSRTNEQSLQDKTNKDTKKSVSSHISSPTDSSRVQSPTLPRGPPTNSLQMERDLRELCGGSFKLTPLAIDYLCSIPPENYLNVINSNLDSDSLGKFILAIAESGSILGLQEQARRLLSLSKLPRFDVAWMMADQPVINITSKIIQELPDGDQKTALTKAFS